MPDVSRRTLVTAGASLLATGASFMMLRGTDAATNEHPQSSGLYALGTVPNTDNHHMGEEMQRCIQLCHDCHTSCVQLIEHCLKLGGRSASSDHIRALLDCAQFCTTTADYMARGSSFHDRTCNLCAEICRRCAESCEQVAGGDQMVKQCAELCRRCAGSCERMGSHKAA